MFGGRLFEGRDDEEREGKGRAYIPEYSQADVYKEIGTAAGYEEDAEGWEEDGYDDEEEGGDGVG